MKLSMLSVPSFKDLLPAFYKPVQDTSMNILKHFPTDLSLPSFDSTRNDLNMGKMMENMKMPQFGAEYKFKDDFLNKFHSSSKSTKWMKSESHSSVCSLMKGRHFNTSK